MSYELHVTDLHAGKTVQFRPRGNSMTPRVMSGETVTASPDTSAIRKGDIVFCRVRGRYYVHLVKAIRADQYLIGNNHGGTNGWIAKNAIFGKVVRVGNNDG